MRYVHRGYGVQSTRCIFPLTLRYLHIARFTDVLRIPERVRLRQRDDSRLRAHPSDDVESDELGRLVERERYVGATAAGVEIGALLSGWLFGRHLHAAQQPGGVSEDGQRDQSLDATLWSPQHERHNRIVHLQQSELENWNARA